MVDVIVGGGIVGASCAYHLAAAGRTALLVDEPLSGRATDAGAGIISALGSRSRGQDWDAFGARSAAYYSGLVDALIDLGEHQHGWSRVGQLLAGDDDLDAVHAHAQRITDLFGADALGTPQIVGRADIARLWPGLRAESAVWLDRVGRVDGRQFRDALLNAFRTLGGRTVGGAAVIRRDRDRVTLHLDGRRLDADTIVLAAGAWTGRMLSEIGLPGDWIVPQRGQILHVSLPGTEGRPIVGAPQHNYLISFPADRLVFGATRETGTGFDPVATVGGAQWLVNGALAILPALRDARVIETRVGLRPASSDGMPVLGPVAGIDNLYLATGLGPSGLTLGPYSGKMVADIVAGASNSVPATFRPDRFIPEPR